MFHRYVNVKKICLIWVTAFILVATSCSNTRITTTNEETKQSQITDNLTNTVLAPSPVLATSTSQITQNPINVTSTYLPLDPSTPIFFTLWKSEGLIEVWQTSVDATIQWQLFSLPTYYPISTLPAQELAILEHDYCKDEQDDCPTRLGHNLNNLTISPDKRWLAWVDTVSWCPNTSCYGVQKIVIWDTSKRNTRTLLEIPIHIDLIGTQAILEIAWSPDSQWLGFVLSSREYSWSRIQAVNIETKQTRDIDEGKSPFAWAADSERVAMRVRMPQGQTWGVKVVDGEGKILITLDNNWDLVSGIDWSPDSNKLAITALTGYQETNTITFGLFIADLVTEEITEVNLDLPEVSNYSNPHWSPDGRWLGVNVSTDGGRKGLVILNLQDGTIRVNFTPEFDVDRWSWSDNGNSILMLANSVPPRIGIFYWSDNRFEIIPFPSSFEDKLDNLDLYLGEPTW